MRRGCGTSPSPSETPSASARPRRRPRNLRHLPGIPARPERRPERRGIRLGDIRILRGLRRRGLLRLPPDGDPSTAAGPARRCFFPRPAPSGRAEILQRLDGPGTPGRVPAEARVPAGKSGPRRGSPAVPAGPYRKPRSPTGTGSVSRLPSPGSPAQRMITHCGRRTSSAGGTREPEPSKTAAAALSSVIRESAEEHGQQTAGDRTVWNMRRSGGRSSVQRQGRAGRWTARPCAVGTFLPESAGTENCTFVQQPVGVGDEPGL